MNIAKGLKTITLGVLALIILIVAYFNLPWILDGISTEVPLEVSRRILNTDLYTFRVYSGNFEPTFYSGDYVLFSRNKPTKPLKRGDLVFYKVPSCDMNPSFIALRDCLYMSRIIGLPGETITLKETSIEINGKKLDEPYAQWRKYLGTTKLVGRFDGGESYKLNEPINIPQGSYFLLDDDRTWSDVDSRLFGPIEENRIVGYYKFLIYKFFLRSIRSSFEG